MRNFRLFFIAFCFAAFWLPQTSSAQITIIPAATAATLANKLVGSGVIIIAPTLTCATNAEGTFSGLSTLSFDSGIVLTSGQANTTGLATGANGPASGFASTANGTPGDPSLDGLIAPITSNDACVLQFDFRPAGDTIKFQYVFGSEEYTDFTCTDFNDVFGFFISGPGYASPMNIALVPGTTIPVCINSVNCGPSAFGSIASCTAMGPGSPFCAYYVNNSAGATITYDGLTTTLTAIARVTPCDTYHLKIGVADASDDILDSGVFLKAGSLSSNSFTATSTGINPADTGFGSQYCIRGCNPGFFVFHNTGSLTDSITIHFNIGGTGVNGIDYTTIPDSAKIQAGHATDTIFIHGLTTASGTKTVELYILAPFTCGGLPFIIDSVELTIYDSLSVHIITPDTSICVGQSVLINTTGSSGIHYLWSPVATLNNSTLQSPTATPTAATTYTVTGSLPGSGCPNSTDMITISVFSPATLNVGPPIQRTCVGVPLPLNCTATPASASYGYSWTPATYLNNSHIANPIVTPGVAGDFEYVVTVSFPGGGCATSDSFLLHVLPNDFTIFNHDTTVCFPPGSYQIYASGDTEFSYLWTPSAGVSNTPIINPVITPPVTGGMFTITGSYPGCPDMVHAVTFTVQNPIINIIPTDTIVCIGPAVTIPVVMGPLAAPYTISWTPSAGLSSSSILMPSLFASPGFYTFSVTLTSSAGCVASDTVRFHVLPNDFTIFNHDTVVCYPPNAYQIFASGYNLFTYVWTPADGVSNANIINPAITPPGGTGVISTEYTITGSYPGCPDMVHHVKYTVENPYINIIPFDTTFCTSQPLPIPVVMTAFDSPYTIRWIPANYLTSDSVLEPSFTNTVPNAYPYTVTLQSNIGCVSTDMVTLHPSPPIQIGLSPGNTTILYGDHIQLQATNLSPTPLIYYWTPNNGTLDNPNINDPVATPLDSVTVYTVYGMNQWGCKDSNSVTITLDYLGDFIPSAFTPNGDGLNDIFRMYNVPNLKLVDFRVMNRWGQIVYENTTDPKKGWDGTFNGAPQDMGVYNYMIIFSRPDGPDKVFKGNVTLIR